MVKIIMKKTIINILSFCLVIIFLAGCSSSTEPDENIILPESNLNFNEHIYPLFSAKCSSRSGCHVISGPAAGLVLVDYNEIITHFMSKVPSEPLVHVGNGDNSPLYRVLIQEGSSGGVPRMPYNGPYLNSNQYEGVKTWINEGAIPSASK
jgi:hypothetical protein